VLLPTGTPDMINTIARVSLWSLVVCGEALGRLLAPARQLTVAHSRGLYGTRHWSHFHAYSAAPGWLFVEMGSWTVEATWRTRSEMSRLKFTA
jgi:hypothetical protein